MCPVILSGCVDLDANADIRCIGQKLTLSDVKHLRLFPKAFGKIHAFVPELRGMRG